MQNDLNTPFAIATVGRNSKSKQPCTIFLRKSWSFGEEHVFRLSFVLGCGVRFSVWFSLRPHLVSSGLLVMGSALF